MDKKEEEFLKTLLTVDDELRQRYEEHLEFEKELNELNRKNYLTPAQDFQRKELQKRKLAGKDKIMQILKRHKVSVPASH